MRQEKLFKTKDDFWQVIQHMVAIIDRKEMEDYITDAVEIKIGYKINDFDFDYSITIENGQINLVDYLSEDIDVLINISSEDFHNLTVGKLNSFQALITKRLRFEKGSLEDMLIIGGLPVKNYYVQACRNLNICV